ncbi:MAG: SIMPL domain-containing protein [Acidimicrobiales bacterium]
MSDHQETSSDQENHDHDYWSMRARRRGPRLVFLVVFAAVIAAIAFIGESLGHSSSSSGATISVTGSGTVTGKPDTMSFQIGVQNVAASAKAALAENNAQMGVLESSLLRHGIVRKNMQTSGLNIYANTNQGGTITGFTVQDTLNVTSHKLNSAGAALDAAANAVGNNVQLNGVTFSISNQSKLLASARARAIQNAHTEASQIAKGAGTTVGGVVRVVDQENTGGGGVFYPTANSFKSAAASVPIQSGSQQLSVQVSVVYHLN